jgi:hypothetical protein
MMPGAKVKSASAAAAVSVALPRFEAMRREEARACSGLSAVVSEITLVALVA